jgi:hypothetical protein
MRDLVLCAVLSKKKCNRGQKHGLVRNIEMKPSKLSMMIFAYSSLTYLFFGLTLFLTALGPIGLGVLQGHMLTKSLSVT